MTIKFEEGGGITGLVPHLTLYTSSRGARFWQRGVNASPFEPPLNEPLHRHYSLVKVSIPLLVHQSLTCFPRMNSSELSCLLLREKKCFCLSTADSLLFVTGCNQFHLQLQ